MGGNFITIDSVRGDHLRAPMVNINSGGAAFRQRGLGGFAAVADRSAEADTANPGENDVPTAIPDTLATTSAAERQPHCGRRAASLTASDAPTHDPNDPENKKKKSWIEIQLIDEDGNPVPGEPYKITLPDGTTIADGTLDDKASRGWITSTRAPAR